MNPPNNAQVEQARINLATAQAAIATNSAILEAAGVAVVPTPATIGPMEISAVALKLPSLWPDNPAKWFLHCEGKFRLHRIVSQQTMFDHCIHAMSAEQSDVVMDLMERGPSDNAYTDLKATYLERRTPTTAERVQRLHALGPLGDQRPSDLLRMIERILGRTVQGDEIATEEFLTRLPERIQLIVRAQTDIFTVEQMAKMADRLVSVPVTHGTFSVAVTPTAPGGRAIDNVHSPPSDGTSDVKQRADDSRGRSAEEDLSRPSRWFTNECRKL